MIKYAFYLNKEVQEHARKTNTVVDVCVSFRTNTFPLMHTHEYWEIIVMRKNSIMNVLNGVRRKMNSEDYCLIRPDDIHFVEPSGIEPPEYYNLMIRKEFFKNVVDTIHPDYFHDLEATSGKYHGSKPEMHKDILDLLTRAFSLSFSRIEEQQVLLRCAVVKLITELLVPQRSAEHSDNLISQILAFMSNPESMTMKLNEIAARFGYCPEHIIRLFQKNNLQSPGAIFTQSKMEYSRMLLSSTDYTTAQIAETIGISDVSYFNKLFKKHYGISPSAYRRSNNSIP